MVHSQAIANTDGVKFNRYPAGVTDAILNGLNKLFEALVAWNDFIKGIGNTNNRSPHFFVYKTQSI